MKIKTSELTGAALDWAVAKCEGLLCFGYCTDGERFDVEDSEGNIEGFMPSTNWEQGGQIIERERISIRPDVAGPDFRAFVIRPPDGLSHRYIGETPLIAAMRCYVASKCGDEIEIPEELK